MRFTGIPCTILVCVALSLLLVAGAPPAALAADMRCAATLVWGTNDPKPPEGKNYKAVQPEIRDKLKELPLKWTNWFQVNHLQFSVPITSAKDGPAKEIQMSAKCQLNVKNFNGSEIEVVVIGKGKEVMRRKQTLPKGELLVLGGNAPNSTAWLVILKRLE